jgi:hypothetical protein
VEFTKEQTWLSARKTYRALYCSKPKPVALAGMAPIMATSCQKENLNVTEQGRLDDLENSPYVINA